MQASITTHVVVGVVAAVATTLVVPLSRALAHRVGAVAQPDERRVHERPTPTLGGLGMLAGFLAALVAAAASGGYTATFASTLEIAGIVGAAVLMYAVGFIDDVREMSAPAKIAGTVLVGSVLALTGTSLFVFRIPFAGFFVLSPDLAAFLTVLWVLGMTNAINLIDGLDGLAAGIVAIASVAFFVYTLQLDAAGLLAPGNPAPLVAVATAGCCVGFLPHNLHPARTFMGDGGALLLGLLLATATIAVGGRTRDPFSGSTFFFFAPLVIPLVILGVPVSDTLFAIIRRARRRSGLATADKGHLHHRLMNLGHGQRRSVAILWAWTALLSAVAVYPTVTGRGDAFVLLALAACALLLYTYFHPGLRR